jgi:hypothetical protein
MNFKAAIALALVPAFLTGCPRPKEEGPGTNGTQQSNDALTLGEATQALEEAQISGQADSLISGSVEITTSFTIGQAVENAAQEIKSFVLSQLPCAEISLVGNTLSIEYGVNPGNCTYNGNTFRGTHTISVDTNEDTDVLVHHEWADLSNGHVSVTGFADVTWSLDDKTRHVVHELTWTRLSDGRQGVGSGDRLQAALGGDITQGFTVDGYRQWQGNAGTWDLDINEIEWQWTDPVPQSGSYVLETPKGKTLSLAFERVDFDTIKVTVSGPRRSFDFLVNKAGGGADDEPVAVEEPPQDGA